MTPKYAIFYHPRTLHQRNYRYYYVPYSIIAAASCLDQHIPCVFVDHNLHSNSCPGELQLPDPTDWAVVGISAMIGRQISDAMSFAEYVRARSPTTPILWGGPCPTMLPDIVLRDAPADYVVLGPGEATVRDLWSALQNKSPLRDVVGLAYRQNGRVLTTDRHPVPDYDSLPPYRSFYARVGVDRYIRSDEHIGSRTLNYHSSQGCSYRCGFCCEPVLWKGRWAGMSPRRILDDLIPLIEGYGVNGIKFYDSEFFIDLPRALQFADLLARRGLPIHWAAAAHPRNILRLTDEELLLLARSGLSRLLIGAETAVAEELDLIRKPLDVRHLGTVADRCAEAGISASFTFVTGYPSFPPENIDRTIVLAEQLIDASSRHEAKIHFFGPYPGTPLYPLAIKHGFQPPATLSDWSKYDYYYVQTPWVPDSYFDRVREFNEHHYPYLVASETM